MNEMTWNDVKWNAWMNLNELMNEWITDWMNEQKHEKHERTGKVMECNEHDVKWSEVNQWMVEWMDDYIFDWLRWSHEGGAVGARKNLRSRPGELCIDVLMWINVDYIIP
jgi:hypothetical protein